MNDDIKRFFTIVIGAVSLLGTIIMVGFFAHVLIKIFMFGWNLIK